MKKLLLILLIVFAATSCDDNYKRDTPSRIENTMWSAVKMPTPETEEQHHLKLYSSTFDLVSQKFGHGELLETSIESGGFTYKMPRVTLFLSDGSAITGLVTGRVMLLENNLMLRLTDSVDAY